MRAKGMMVAVTCPPARSRKLDVGGIELCALEAGSGGSPLLLIHGFTGAKEDFGEIIGPLAESGWHTVAPDLRGHGQSDHPRGVSSYSIQQFVSDITSLVKALGWSKLVLLGHSMGGMIAQVVALQHPSLLDGLVLMDTTHGPLEGFDVDMVAASSQIVATEGLGKLVELRRDFDDPLATPAHLRLLAQRPGYREFGDAKVLACAADMWVAMVDGMLHLPDRLADLSRIDVPTLVLVGEQDANFIGASHAIARAIPGAVLEIISDAGHSPQFENQPGWWSATAPFLDRIRRQSRA